MTKAKKAIGVILAVVMLATMFAFGSLAVTPGNATFTVTPSATNVEVNDTVTVTVKVTTDYYASAVGVPVHFDASLFDFVEGSFTPNTDIYGAAGSADYRANYDDNGCFTVAFAPKSEVAGAKATVLTDVTLFTFQLTAKANGVSPVQLKAEDQKTAANMTGTLYCGQQPTSELDYSQTVLVGQTFTLNNSSVTIGSAEANTLKVKDDFEGKDGVVIDTTSIPILITDEWYPGFADAVEATATGLVYGIDTIGYDDNFASDLYPTLQDALTTSLGDEYLVVTPYTNEDGITADLDSTGAKIEVLGADKVTVVETYYFIYFGDVNGDAYVDGVDATAIGQWDFYQDSLTSICALVACDYNGDTYMDGLDFTEVARVDFRQENYAIQAEVANSFYTTMLGM